jgi:hypothetical protein
MGPPNDHYNQVWFNFVQWFKQKILSREMLLSTTDGCQVVVKDHIVFCLFWPGELTMYSRSIMVKRPGLNHKSLSSILMHENFPILNTVYIEGLGLGS